MNHLKRSPGATVLALGWPNIGVVAMNEGFTGCGGRRDRTFDQWLKRPLLYR